MEALRQPKPRSVPKRFEYTEPLATLFLALGTVFVVILLLLFSVGARSVGAGQSLIERVLNTTYLAVPFAFLVYGLMNRKVCRKYFAHGDVVKGKVVSIRTTGAKMNGRRFFRVGVEFQARDGTHRAYDIVDDFSMEYFTDARDHDAEVDFLFLPSSPRKVLLIHKIATARRFD